MTYRHQNTRRPRTRHTVAERLESRRLFAVLAWGGDGGDGLWSNPLNWQGNVAPTANDELQFFLPGGGATLVNDLPANTSFQGITFVGDAGYRLAGNAITLGDSIVNASSAQNEIALPLKLSGTRSIISDAFAPPLVISGNIDTNGHDVVFDGDGETEVSGVISGAGDIDNEGTGSVSLTAANIFTGNSAAVAGTIYANNATGSATGTGALSILQGAVLRGAGAIAGEAIILGAILPGAGVGTTGILETGDLTVIGAGDVVSYNVNINGPAAGTGYDQISVTGPVDLGDPSFDPSPRLQVELSPEYAPTPGSTYTIISNDGSDPVGHIFRNLAEGKTLVAGASQDHFFRVSYLGGDGNDVVLTFTGTAATWDGGGSNNNWSSAANWAGDVAPVAGQHLVFPDFADGLSNTNDLSAGTSFASIRVTGQGYHLAGNAVSLTEGVFSTAHAETSSVALPITLAADAAFRADSDARLLVSGAVDTAGHELTLGGDGDFGAVEVSGAISGGGRVTVSADAVSTPAVTLSGTNTHTGGTSVERGELFLHADQPGSITNVAGSMMWPSGLRGLGTTGPLTVAEGGYVAPGDAGALGGLTVSGNATLAPESAGLELRLGDSTDEADRLIVNGAVSLGGSPLSITRFNEAAPAGTSFVIVENDGADPVVGTFDRYVQDTDAFTPLAEGGRVELQMPFGLGGTGQLFRITYAGGDGNDVVLTAEGPGAFGFDVQEIAVDEDAGEATVTVNRAGTLGTASVAYATSDLPGILNPATPDEDYTPTSGVLTFVDGQTQATITVPLADDDAIEGDERFRITLSAPTGGASLGEADEAVVTIEDTSGRPVLSVNDVTVNEGTAGATATATFNVALSHAVGVPVAVSYTTAAGTATAGSDFTPAEGRLTFAAGETAKAVAVQVNGDLTDESDETFVLQLAAPENATLGDGQGVGTITDDDSADPLVLNLLPVAANDMALVTAGQLTRIDVLANDSDADGNPLTLSLTGTAPAHGTAVIDDNGTPADPTDDVIAYTPAAGYAGADTFTYAVSDGAGGTDTATVNVITQGAAAVIVDPTDATKTTLVTGGTSGADDVKFVVRKGGGIEVIVNRQSRGTFSPTGSVIADLGDGADRIKFGKLPVPVTIAGGEGDDRITGTAFADTLIGGPGNDRFDGAGGDDVLVGGDGDDRLTGGAGRDLLVGGAGADTLAGGADDDVLVAGPTAYDADTPANRAALADLRAAFAAPGLYASRVAAITAPAGVGASGARLSGNGTVLDDVSVDTLNGGAATDLFFAHSLTGGTVDRLQGRKSGEAVFSL